MATAPAAPATMTLDRSDGSATMDLYRAALGPVHTDRYLRAFTRFDAAGKAGLSWNWSAALLTLNWMLFRRLWLAALAYVGIVAGALLLLFGIGRLLFQLEGTNLWALTGLGVLLAVVVPGAYGNAWLYAACNKAMTRALAASATMEEACEQLRKRSNGRPQLIGLAIGNAVLVAAVGALVGSWPGSKAEHAQAATASGLVTADTSSAPSRSSQGVVQPAPLLQASAATSVASAVAPLAVAPPTSAPASAPAHVASAAATVASAPLAAKAKASTAEALAKPTKAELQAKALEAKKEKQEKAKEAKEAKAAKLALEAKAAKEAKEAKEAKAKPVAKASASAASASPPAADQYLINVGLFADPNNARNAYAKLQDAGLPATIKELKSTKGPQTRVRAGPFDSEAEAERAAEKIRGLRLDAVVIKP